MYKPFSYREAQGLLNHAMEVEVTGGWGRRVDRRLVTLWQVTASVVRLCVVQASVQRLKKTKATRLDTDGIVKCVPNAIADGRQVANDERRGNQDNENNQHDEVENGETNNPSLS